MLNLNSFRTLKTETKMKFILLILTLVPIDAFNIGSAGNVVGAAKKFLTGTKRTKATQNKIAQQTAAHNYPPQYGQSDDGIMKKSVDFLSNGALIVGGLGSIVNHFTGTDTPVSSFLLF